MSGTAPERLAELVAYVRAAAALHGLSLDEVRIQGVATHLERTAGLAQLLAALDLPVELEPAELYRPAAFPEEFPGETAR